MNNYKKLIKKLERIIINNLKSSRKFRRIIRDYKIGSFAFRMKINALRRVPYAYICFNAALLAKKLGYERISVIEYGAGEGSGLLSLEEYTDQIDIYGFDSGQGLPKPNDYRDLPYHFLRHPMESWHHQIWIIHFFKHLKYNLFISQDNPQLTK